MSRHTTIECQADVDVFDLAAGLSSDEKIELAYQLLHDAQGNSGNGSDQPLAEQVRLLGHALQRCDEAAAAELLHRLCFDVANVPVINRLRIEPLQVAA